MTQFRLSPQHLIATLNGHEKNDRIEASDFQLKDTFTNAPAIRVIVKVEDAKLGAYYMGAVFFIHRDDIR